MEPPEDAQKSQRPSSSMLGEHSRNQQAHLRRGLSCVGCREEIVKVSSGAQAVMAKRKILKLTPMGESRSEDEKEF